MSIPVSSWRNEKLLDGGEFLLGSAVGPFLGDGERHLLERIDPLDLLRNDPPMEGRISLGEILLLLDQFIRLLFGLNGKFREFPLGQPNRSGQKLGPSAGLKRRLEGLQNKNNPYREDGHRERHLNEEKPCSCLKETVATR